MYTILDFFGYFASLIILISLSMKSIVKLRLINFIGAILFFIYALLINSLPVAFLNIILALINAIYLYKIIKNKNKITLLEIENESKYLEYIYNKNIKDITKFFPNYKIKNNQRIFFMLRNNNLAGILALSHSFSEYTNIELDYVYSEFRDFKIGEYLFLKKTSILRNFGYKKFKIKSNNKLHLKYLKRLKFIKNEDEVFIKEI